MKSRTILSILLALAAPVALAAPAKTAAVNGEKIYTATCLACHGAGLMGAPKTGDKAAWKPRLARGVDAMYESARKGIRMMPPSGGNPTLKEAELKAAVDFMISK